MPGAAFFRGRRLEGRWFEPLPNIPRETLSCPYHAPLSALMATEGSSPPKTAPPATITSAPASRKSGADFAETLGGFAHFCRERKIVEETRRPVSAASGPALRYSFEIF